MGWYRIGVIGHGICLAGDAVQRFAASVLEDSRDEVWAALHRRLVERTGTRAPLRNVHVCWDWKVGERAVMWIVWRPAQFFRYQILSDARSNYYEYRIPLSTVVPLEGFDLARDLPTRDLGWTTEYRPGFADMARAVEAVAFKGHRPAEEAAEDYAGRWWNRPALAAHLPAEIVDVIARYVVMARMRPLVEAVEAYLHEAHRSDAAASCERVGSPRMVVLDVFDY